MKKLAVPYFEHKENVEKKQAKKLTEQPVTEKPVTVKTIEEVVEQESTGVQE